MPDELKINVGVGGAKEAEAALKGVAAAEHAVGAAAKAGAPALGQAAGGAKDLGEGVKFSRAELSMLALSLGDLGIQVPGLNLVLRTLLTGAINPVTLGITAGMLAIYGLTSALKSSKVETEAAREALAALNNQCNAYLEMSKQVEKAARGRRGAGVGAGAAYLEQLTKMELPGVGPEEKKRAAELASKAGRAVSPEELGGLAMQVTLGKEPEKGADWAKARRMLGGQDLGALRAGMALVPPREAAAATFESQMAAEALTPAGQMAERLERLDRYFKIHPEAVPTGSTIEDVLLKRIRAKPAFGMERGVPFVGEYGGTGFLQGPGGAPAITIVERAVFNQGGVHYAAPDSDPAGQIPRSTRR